MVVGIKVDKGVVPLAGTNGETTTQGENPITIYKIDYQVVKLHMVFYNLSYPLKCWN